MSELWSRVVRWVRLSSWSFFFFQAEDGIRDLIVTGVQTCALPIYAQQFPAALPHIGAPPNELLPFLRGRPEYPQVRDLLPLCRVRFRRRGHREVGDRKSVGVGKECRSRWSPYH